MNKMREDRSMVRKNLLPTVAVTAEEDKEIRTAAQKMGLTIAGFARLAMLRLAREEND